MGDFLGDFLLSLGDFLTKTSGHPDNKLEFYRLEGLVSEKHSSLQGLFLQRKWIVANTASGLKIIAPCVFQTVPGNCAPKFLLS